jgi:hypothetical protein
VTVVAGRQKAISQSLMLRSATPHNLLLSIGGAWKTATNDFRAVPLPR